MTNIAAEFWREVPDLVKGPLIAEFEHVIVTGLAEIFRRPVVVEFKLQLVVEEVVRDAGPDFEIIIELAIGIERARYVS